MTSFDSEILIVGAGMAGLMAAHSLIDQGHKVILVDKGRSVGGRLATRRIGPGRADHGAQFFSVRSATFRDMVARWLEDDLVYAWSYGWSDGSLVADQSDGYSRYAVRGGMNALAKHLAEGLDVHVNVRLTAVGPTADGWQATDEYGNRYTSRALIMTPPVPQTLALLAAGGTRLTPNDHTALKRITYAPCLAGLFWVEGRVNLPGPGAIQRREPDVIANWIADNQRKGISPEATLITVHGSPQFSTAHIDGDDDEVLAILWAELDDFITDDIRIIEAQFKRWHYALPTTLHPERTLLAVDLPPLAFAGDAFDGPRVEGAILSGMAAGEALAERLSVS